MKDTTPAIEKMVKERMMRLSGEDRLRMGASMFDSAREMVLASLPRGTSSEVRRGVFMRFYGKDFDEVRREKIIDYLTRDDGTT